MPLREVVVALAVCGVMTTFLSSQLREAIGGYWLALVDIDPCRGNPTLAQRVHQSVFVDHRPARCIDQHCGGFHFPQCALIDEMARSGCERYVERDEIGAHKQLFERDAFGADIALHLLATKLVGVEHLHVEALGFMGESPTDAASSYHAEGRARYFLAYKLQRAPTAPSSGPHDRVRLDDSSPRRKE